MMKTLQAIQQFLDVSRYRRYGLAVFVSGLAWAISRIFFTQNRPATFASLVVAVVLSAWLAGRRPGLLSTILVPVAAQMNFVATGQSERPVAFVLWTTGAACFALTLAYARSAVLRRARWQAMLPLTLWDQDPRFNQIMQTIQHTLVDRTRCYMLYQFARQTSHLAGEVAEVGVYKGGTAKLLAKTLPQKKVHLFDTFAGMPATKTDFDKHLAGEFSDTSLAAVQERLKDCRNVHFYAGLFPATSVPIEQAEFSLVHVDADIYDSVRACCEFFYSRLERGAIMLFDDYGFPTCPGARKAVDEFFSDKPEIPFYLPTGQCWVVRK